MTDENQDHARGKREGEIGPTYIQTTYIQAENLLGEQQQQIENNKREKYMKQTAIFDRLWPFLLRDK